MSAWKQFERDSAELIKGARFWANAGERVDVQGSILGVPVRGQCKLVKRLSLEALTRLAEEDGVDVVMVKVRRGAGKESQPLIVFTFQKWRDLISQVLT